MEDAVEDERQDKGQEAEQAATIKRARELDECSGLGRALVREASEGFAEARVLIECRCEGLDVLKGRVDAEAKVGLDRVYRVP